MLFQGAHGCMVHMVHIFNLDHRSAIQGLWLFFISPLPLKDLRVQAFLRNTHSSLFFFLSQETQAPTLGKPPPAHRAPPRPARYPTHPSAGLHPHHHVEAPTRVHGKQATRTAPCTDSVAPHPPGRNQVAPPPTHSQSGVSMGSLPGRLHGQPPISRRANRAPN